MAVPENREQAERIAELIVAQIPMCQAGADASA